MCHGYYVVGFHLYQPLIAYSYGNLRLSPPTDVSFVISASAVLVTYSMSAVVVNYFKPIAGIPPILGTQALNSSIDPIYN